MILVFKSFSLDWLYFFFDFGFWLSVRNGLYFVFGFVFLYILFYIGYPPILFGLPFFIWPRWSPPFIQSIKTKINFYLSSIRSCSCCYCSASSRPRESSSVDCSYLQNVLELLKYAKHTINATTTMIYLNTHAPVFMPSYYLSSYPSKKNNYFLSTSHLVYPFQKSVVLTSASVYYVDNNAMSEKRIKIQRLWYGLTCTFKK